MYSLLSQMKVYKKEKLNGEMVSIVRYLDQRIKFKDINELECFIMMVYHCSSKYLHDLSPIIVSKNVNFVPKV